VILNPLRRIRTENKHPEVEVLPDGGIGIKHRP